MQYLALFVFALLLGLASFNFVQIIVKQKRYKTLPLLAFYLLSLIAITLRILAVILFVSDLVNVHHYFDFAQPICKLQIGLI